MNLKIPSAGNPVCLQVQNRFVRAQRRQLGSAAQSVAGNVIREEMGIYQLGISLGSNQGTGLGTRSKVCPENRELESFGMVLARQKDGIRPRNCSAAAGVVPSWKPKAGDDSQQAQGTIPRCPSLQSHPELLQDWISNLEFKPEIETWISNLGFKPEIQTWILNLGFKSGFQIWISNLDIQPAFQTFPCSLTSPIISHIHQSQGWKQK